MENQPNKIDQLMKALFNLHREFGVTIRKDSKGHKGTYASLPCVLESLHEMCDKHDLILHQQSCILEGKNALVTTLYHVPSNQSISSVSLLTPHPEPQSYDQAWGGSSTYHRRYDAMMLMGVFADEDPTDNDGHVEEKPQSINPKQLGLLKAKLNGNKDLEGKILKTLNIADLSQVPWKRFNAILEFIEGK